MLRLAIRRLSTIERTNGRGNGVDILVLVVLIYKRFRVLCSPYWYLEMKFDKENGKNKTNDFNWEIEKIGV